MCVRTPTHVWSSICSKLIPNPPLQPSTWDSQQSCPWTWQHTYMCHKRHKHNEQRRSKACRSQLRAYGECTSLKTYWWNQMVYLQKCALYRKSKLIILMILPRNISSCCKLAWTEAKLRCLFPKAAYFTSIYKERLIISIPEELHNLKYIFKVHLWKEHPQTFKEKLESTRLTKLGGMVLRSIIHQNEMLNGFQGLKVSSWHSCPKLFTGSSNICFCIIFSSGNMFSYAHFTLLSPPTAEVKQGRSPTNKIIILWHNYLSK